MPPFSKEVRFKRHYHNTTCFTNVDILQLYQEGAAIKSFKVVQNGELDMKGIKHYLYDVPGSYPGCSGTRLLRDNVSGM